MQLEDYYVVRSVWPPMTTCKLCWTMVWPDDQAEHFEWHNRQVKIQTRGAR